LLRSLPGAPFVTVKSAAALVGRTFAPANEAIKRLVDAGILSPVKVGRRNRAFEAADVIEAFTALERQLASPRGARGRYSRYYVIWRGCGGARRAQDWAPIWTASHGLPSGGV
jgi:hypothetical protein